VTGLQVLDDRRQFLLAAQQPGERARDGGGGVGFGVRAATGHLDKRSPDRTLKTHAGSESVSSVGIQAPTKAPFDVADGPSAHPCALSELLLGQPRFVAEAAKQRSERGHAPTLMSAEVGDQLGEQRFVAFPADQADAGVPPRRSEDLMNTEQHKQVVLKLYELLNNGDAERIGELVTQEYVEHDPLPGQGNGREGREALTAHVGGWCRMR